MSTKKTGKGRKASNRTATEDGSVSAPNVSQSVVAVEQTDTDVAFHHVAPSEPAIVSPVESATIVPPTNAAPKPIRLRQNGHESGHALVKYVLDSADVPYDQACQAIRALAADFTKTNRFGREFADRAKIVGQPGGPTVSELRGIAIGLGYRSRFLPGGMYSRPEYAAQYREVLSQIVAQQSPEDTLPASVPEFAVAEQLAAQ